VLRITKATVRNQLKAVFAKAGIHRQAELVTLLATIFMQP
jgi:DNA-binding CsgD family transcriptional regulator